MKALSVGADYAVALAMFEKHIEFRSRPTAHRGDLLICSSKRKTGAVYITEDGESINLPYGYAVCVREVVDCRPMTKDDLEEFGAPDTVDGWYSWVLAEDRGDPCIPFKVKGSLSFFNVDDDLIHYTDQDFTNYEYEGK